MKESILLITVDSLRQDHLGCYGHRVKTPIMDSLADQGCIFTNAFSNGVGTPAGFKSLLASTRPLMFSTEPGLSGCRKTIAEIFKEEGYHTLGFTGGNPYLFYFDRGFEIFDNQFQGNEEEHVGNEDIRQDGEPRVELLQDMASFILNKSPHAWRLMRFFKHLLGIVPYERADHSVKKCLSLLSSYDLSPFFLWVHFMDVHHVYLPPTLSLTQRLLAAKLDDKLKYASSKIDERELRTLQHLYDKEIEYVDGLIGVLLKGLKQLGWDSENMLTVVTSDHGEEFMEHGGLGHGAKLYDELMRVPLIITGLGVHSAKVSSPVSLIDVAPTVLSLLGVPRQGCFQGKPLITYPTKDATGRSSVICEAVRKNSLLYCIRTNNLKLIVEVDNEGNPIREERYDLKKGPSEKINISSNERFELLRKELLSYVQNEMESRKQIRSREKRIDRHIRARLRELGYF